MDPSIFSAPRRFCSTTFDFFDPPYLAGLHFSSKEVILFKQHTSEVVGGRCTCMVSMTHYEEKPPVTGGSPPILEI